MNNFFSITYLSIIILSLKSISIRSSPDIQPQREGTDFKEDGKALNTHRHIHEWALPVRKCLLLTSALRAPLLAETVAACCPASHAQLEPGAGRWVRRALKRHDSSLGIFQA